MRRNRRRLAQVVVGLALLGARPLFAEDPFTVLGVQPARIEQTVQDVILIRVRVASPGDFAPSGALPPQFILGEATCQMLRDPLADGVAVLVAPAPEGSARPSLWLAPGLPSTAYTPQAVKKMRTKTKPKPVTKPLTAKKSWSAPVKFADLAAIVKTVNAPEQPR